MGDDIQHNLLQVCSNTVKPTVPQNLYITREGTQSTRYTSFTMRTVFEDLPRAIH